MKTLCFLTVSCWLGYLHMFSTVLFFCRGWPTSSSNFEGDNSDEPSWDVPFFGEKLPSGNSGNLTSANIHSFLYVHQRVVHQEILEFYQEQLGINPAILVNLQMMVSRAEQKSRWSSERKWIAIRPGMPRCMLYEP